jgi:CHAT domain-containing protein
MMYMRRWVLCSILWTWSLICFGQYTDPNPFPVVASNHPLYQQAKSAFAQQQYPKAIQYWQEVIARYPDAGTAYYEEGISYLQTNELDKAFQSFSTGYELKPDDAGLILHLGILNGLINKEQEARFYFHLFSTIASNDKGYFDAQLSYVTSYANYQASRFQQGAALINKLVVAAKQEHTVYWPIYNQKVLQPEQQVANWVKNNNKTAILNWLKQVKQAVIELKLPTSIYHRMILYAADEAYVEKSDLLSAIVDIMDSTFREGMTSGFLQFEFASYLTKSLEKTGDYEGCLTYNSIILDALTKNPSLHYLLVETYIKRIQWLSKLDRKKEAISLSAALEKTALQYKNAFMIADMYEALCIAYSDTDGPKSVTYGEKGLTYAQQKGIRTSSLRSALMVAYSFNKQFDKAEALSGTLSGSTIQMENKGTLLLNQYEYEKAIPFFEKAYEGFESDMYKTSKANERYLITQEMYRVVQKLAYCYGKQEQYEQAFNLIERSKGSVLASKTAGSKYHPIALKEIQRLLGPEDALVYFVESIYEGDFMAFVVTPYSFNATYIQSINGLRIILKKYNSYLQTLDKEMANEALRMPTMKAMDMQTADKDVVFNEGEFSLIVEMFRRSMNTPATQEGFNVKSVFNTLSRSLSMALMNEVFSYAAMQKRLIIVPDGALNYLPFEALRTPLGKFMIEKYDISYIPSANVLKSLQERTYGARKKTLLAMGGAQYAATSGETNPVKSLADVEKLRLKVLTDLESNKPVQYAYRALGYQKMNYLPGTLTEVQGIKNSIPTTDVVSGDAMQESLIKAMSKRGELASYRVLHFATHGWVVPMMDALSGIAMTIPETDAAGEDGYLVLSEAEQLNLKADLVMLSACQTALGKNVKGEGVIGLTQAFLGAGANATISSLWPVNDYATSIMVQEIYKQVFKEGQTFYEALNSVKRNFLKGSYNTDSVDLTDPVYWAPFIYYGKL